MSVPDPWTGQGAGLSRCLVHSSGWRVLHCGHGQAHRTWVVSSPEGVDYVRGNGGAWSRQASAKAAAEALAAGHVVYALPMVVRQEIACAASGAASSGKTSGGSGSAGAP